MVDHYYTANPTSAHDLREIEVAALGIAARFTTDAGVFSRDGLDRGTQALLGALPPLSGSMLDMGCGWGAIGVTLGKKYPELEIVMADVNSRAVELSRANAAKNGVRAEVVQSDGFSNIERSFDCVITNPPIRAGKQTIYGMFADAREHLNPGGSLWIVIRKQQGAPSALKALREMYAEAEVVDREAGFWTIRAVK